MSKSRARKSKKETATEIMGEALSAALNSAKEGSVESPPESLPEVPPVVQEEVPVSSAPEVPEGNGEIASSEISVVSVPPVVEQKRYSLIWKRTVLREEFGTGKITRWVDDDARYEVGMIEGKEGREFLVFRENPTTLKMNMSLETEQGKFGNRPKRYENALSAFSAALAHCCQSREGEFVVSNQGEVIAEIETIAPYEEKSSSAPKKEGGKGTCCAEYPLCSCAARIVKNGKYRRVAGKIAPGTISPFTQERLVGEGERRSGARSRNEDNWGSKLGSANSLVNSALAQGSPLSFKCLMSACHLTRGQVRYLHLDSLVKQGILNRSADNFWSATPEGKRLWNEGELIAEVREESTVSA